MCLATGGGGGGGIAEISGFSRRKKGSQASFTCFAPCCISVFGSTIRLCFFVKEISKHGYSREDCRDREGDIPHSKE